MVPKQQSRVTDQFKINAVNFNILNEFSDYSGKKSFSVIYWEMEVKFSPLSLMSLNPIKVPEFLRCSLKFIKRLNGAPEKRKLMPSA